MTDPARDPDPDADRDATVVRPATTFVATQVLADATVVEPRAAGGAGDDGPDDRDATVIRATLHRLRDADRTRPGGVPLRPLPRTSPALPPGTQLHEYRIERVLGQGGFGITYLATDGHLDAQVAIKEYLPEEIAFRAHDRSVSPHASQHRERYQQGLENFLAEARTLASFRHPHIVRVARFFEANSTAYMVLEYERGRSLRKWWKAQGADGERLLQERLHRLLDGLAVVHAAGYLHRDIKPDNIQVRSDDGRFVLLDFGSSGQTVALADQDAVVVTPGYAPLEQYGAGEQGPWTDLYALGATLYWVVAGRKPPDAESRASGTAMPSALELGRERFGPRFLAAIDWALQMDPAARPRSVQQWREHLLGDLPGAHAAAAAVRPGDSTFGPGVAGDRGQRVQRALRRAGAPHAWPLTTKLPLLVAGTAALVLAGGALAWAIGDVGAALRAAPSRQLETQARLAAQALTVRLADQSRLMRGLAGDPALARLLVQADATAEGLQQQALAALLRAHADWQTLALVDPAGRARMAASADAAEPPAALNRALQAHRRALAGGRGFVATGPGAGLWLGEPVRDPGGIVVGHLVLHALPEAYTALLRDAAAGVPGQVRLVDGDGLQLYPVLPGGREARLDEPALVQAVRSAAGSTQATWRRGGLGGVGGDEQLAGLARVRDTPWWVVLEVPRDALQPSLARLTSQLWLAGGAALLLALWVARRHARALVRALRRLGQGVQSVRDGDLAHAAVDLARRDELGRLGRDFNEMVDALRQRERERERTGRH